MVGPDFKLRTHAAYREVEMEYWPQVRWWLPEGLATDRTLDSNLEQIHDAGFGGIEIIAIPEDGVDHTVYGWGSDEWNEDSRRVIRGAVRRGLAFSLTSGAHWGTANIPDTHAYGGQPYDLDSPAAAQELDYASIVIRGGETFAGPVPPLTLPQKAKGARVVTLLGVLAVHLESERRSIEAADGTFTQTQGVLDLKTVVDLTPRVAEGGGTVEFTAPGGVDVELFAFYIHGTGQTADPSFSVNYTINYFDPAGAEALTDYWDRNVLTDDVRADLARSGLGELYMDSLELSTYGQGGLLWGRTMRDEFKRRRGYDVLPYLPFLVKNPDREGAVVASSRLALLIAAGAVRNSGNGRIVTNYRAESEDSQGVIEKVMNDLYRTMSELYCENTLGPIRQWLHGHHMKLRAEPSYGYTLEISTPARYLDGVEIESYAQAGELDLYRNMLGSANMYGRPFSSETGAVARRNYFYNMDDWTQLAYLQFALGVVRTVLHGWAGIEGPESSTHWPGHEGMYPWYSERFDGRQPASTAYPEWTRMLARNQKF
ncbi:MAG TPA: glycosyl hydrolase, partial [Acidimicrobiales bacterium]|nr:glycosyl hydrolase [Acidimicrobiales bacterium]